MQHHHNASLEQVEEAVKWLQSDLEGSSGKGLTPVGVADDPEGFLFFFYSGVGYVDDGKRALEVGDTSAGYTRADQERPVVGGAFELDIFLKQLSSRAGLSAAVLDTNFNPVTLVPQSEFLIGTGR